MNVQHMNRPELGGYIDLICLGFDDEVASRPARDWRSLLQTNRLQMKSMLITGYIWITMSLLSSKLYNVTMKYLEHITRGKIHLPIIKDLFRFVFFKNTI